MANENRVRANNVFGTLSADLTVEATTLSSPDFADLPPVGSTEYAVLALGSAKLLEIVHVTSHLAGATTVTVLRGQEGTTAKTWATSTKWRHVPTANDFSHLLNDIYKGEYADRSYSRGNLVTYDGGLYLANEDLPATGTTVFDATKWTFLSVADLSAVESALAELDGGLQALTGGLTLVGVWDPAKSYEVGESVAFDNLAYTAIAPVEPGLTDPATNSDPSTSSIATGHGSGAEGGTWNATYPWTGQFFQVSQATKVRAVSLEFTGPASGTIGIAKGNGDVAKTAPHLGATSFSQAAAGTGRIQLDTEVELDPNEWYCLIIKAAALPGGKNQKRFAVGAVGSEYTLTGFVSTMGGFAQGTGNEAWWSTIYGGDTSKIALEAAPAGVVWEMEGPLIDGVEPPEYDPAKTYVTGNQVTRYQGVYTALRSVPTNKDPITLPYAGAQTDPYWSQAPRETAIDGVDGAVYRLTADASGALVLTKLTP